MEAERMHCETMRGKGMRLEWIKGEARETMSRNEKAKKCRQFYGSSDHVKLFSIDLVVAQFNTHLFVQIYLIDLR